MHSPSRSKVRVVDAALYFLPATMRMPLKFGNQVLTNVTCARATVRIEDECGKQAIGWGETPLSVGWVWPSPIDYGIREQALKQFAMDSTIAFREFPVAGHPLEVGHAFIHQGLPRLQTDCEAKASPSRPALPHLAALVSFSPLDIALHDAFGNLLNRPIYELYGPDSLGTDLSAFLQPAKDSAVTFEGRFPSDYLTPRRESLPVWHLVGGLDPVEAVDLKGDEPDDGYPVLLRDWIRRDGLNCLKVKLRGNDSAWDYQRLVQIGGIAQEEGVDWLTADFNCSVSNPDYVNEILDRLRDEAPRVYQMLLYVEQPFPYDLPNHQIDVHSVSARKPLFMDESAHDWELIRLGRGLGWNGVALKTCKTQTGALLSLCWAKAHGMGLMVQDLTNPMLAQIPHVQLAAHAGTIMGVESNGMQFYPEVSLPEQQIHPGLYQRRNGVLDLSTLTGSGFGYRLEEIQRELPEPTVAFKG